MDRFTKLLADKARKKREILGKNYHMGRPVLLVDLSNEKNGKEFNDLIAGLSDLEISVMVLPAIKGKKSELQRATESTATAIVLAPEQKTAALAAADFVLMPGADCRIAWEYGCIPVCQLNGNGSQDYNPLQEKGNGFYFKKPTKWEMFAAVVRARETYQFPYDWENLVREVLKKVK